ncbi:MAG: RHS repeat-associated core domain-containing protein [Sumerlaeia bacterium]
MGLPVTHCDSNGKTFDDVRLSDAGLGEDDGQRTRYDFSGITEEVKKVSVEGAHTDSAFAFTTKYDAETANPASWTRITDNVRRSTVYDFAGWTADGAFRWDAPGTNGWNITGHKTFSVWLKTQTLDVDAEFTLHFVTQSGVRGNIRYKPNTTSEYWPGTNDAIVGIDGEAGDYNEGGWFRLERDLSADVRRLWPSDDLGIITGMAIWAGSSTHMYMDDLKFSNSVTVERNVLAGNTVGQIVRTVQTDHSDPTQVGVSDKYYHYNQVGSVAATTSGTGSVQGFRYADGFGNVLQASSGSYLNGVWSGNMLGLGHNTKSFDPLSGSIYMLKRWYIGSYGLFMSRAPFAPSAEHQYNYAEQNPVTMIDPWGLCPICCDPTYFPPGPPSSTPPIVDLPETIGGEPTEYRLPRTIIHAVVSFVGNATTKIASGTVYWIMSPTPIREDIPGIDFPHNGDEPPAPPSPPIPPVAPPSSPSPPSSPLPPQRNPRDECG